MNNRKVTKKTSDALVILDKITGNDPKLRAQIDDEITSLRIGHDVKGLRIKAGLSQAELAKRIGTTQSVISRLEDAEYEGHSIPMLQRIAAALDKRIEVRFETAIRVTSRHSTIETCGNRGLRKSGSGLNIQ